MSKAKKKAPAPALPPVLVGQMSVRVKYRGVDANMYGDALTMVHVRCAGDGSAQFDLANKLRELADFFAGSADEYGGGAEVVVLRRKSR